MLSVTELKRVLALAVKIGLSHSLENETGAEAGSVAVGA